MIDVSVVIVNYNTITLTLQCVQSILDKTFGVSYEIIIIDNNSGDDIELAVNQSFGDTSCNIVCKKLSENVGFGRGNNEGVLLAKGRHIFCLNPDTILVNNSIKLLSDYLDQHTFVGACGGNLYDKNMMPNHSFRRYLLGWKWELNILTFDKLEKALYGKNTSFNYTDHPLEVGYITGADLMIKRSVYESIGGFSPEFFMYFEETDLCYKIKRKGYKIMSVPDAKIVHLEGGSFKEQHYDFINEKAIERSENGRIIYYIRNKTKIVRILLNFIYVVSLSINRLFFAKKGNEIWRYYDCKLRFFRKACILYK